MKIEEATSTIEQTRSIALALTRVALTDLMADNFMSSTTLAVRLNLHDELVGQLNEIGASAEQIADAENVYHSDSAPPQGQLDSGCPAVADGFNDLLNFDEWRAPSPAEMESFLNSNDAITPAVQAWIDDYRHYLETGIIRRKDLFEAS